MSKRFLLVHRYYAPDVTTYAQMMRHFGERLVESGHQTSVLATQPSYNGVYQGPKLPSIERTDAGITVRRMRSFAASSALGKVLGYIAFPLQVFGYLFRNGGSYDVVSVTTVPPLAMAFVARLARLRHRHLRVVYHCMDLYPEVLGSSAGRSLGARSLRWLARRVDRANVEESDVVIVLSEDMRSTLARRAEVARVQVQNNFLLQELSGPNPSSEQNGSGDRNVHECVKFVFAGNLGEFQGLDVLAEAFAQHPEASLRFQGAGSMQTALAAAVDGHPNLSMAPFVPLDELFELLEGFDVAVVSLAPGVVYSAYPSKLMTYFEAGLPVLAVVEGDSALAATIESNGIGAVAQPGDLASIRAAVDRLVDGARSGRFESGAIRAVGRAMFGRDKTLDRWVALYEQAAS